MKRALQAVDLWVKRKDRELHPEGRWDTGGRWYPMTAEVQKCCASIRRPSRKWPLSLQKHCRGKEHVAALYGVTLSEFNLALYLKDHDLLSPELVAALEVIHRSGGKQPTNQQALRMAKKIEASKQQAA